MIKEKIVDILHKNGYDLITACEIASAKIAVIRMFFIEYPKTTSYTFCCCGLYITIGYEK